MESDYFLEKYLLILLFFKGILDTTVLSLAAPRLLETRERKHLPSSTLSYFELAACTC